MEKIQNFSLHNFHSNEHGQFMTDVDTFILKYTALELGIDALYPTFKRLLVDEEQAISSELGSNKTERIKYLDVLRDNTLNAIYGKVESTLKSPFTDEAESARVIQHIIDIDGDIRNWPYNEETNAIANLIRKLQQTANVAHTDRIGITAWITALKTQNDDFQVLNNDRNEEFAGRTNGNTKEARKAIDPVYNQIVERINASIVLEVAKPVVAHFVNELNQKITYYKTTIANRNGRNNKNNGSQTDNSTPTIPKA